MKTRYAALLTLALGLAANAPALAADCSVTVNSIVAQTVVLKANCGNNSTDVTWLKNGGALSGVLSFPQTNADIFYTTPLLSGVNSYTATTTTGSGASALAAIITGAQWLLTVAPTAGGTVNSSLGAISACTSVGGVCAASYDNGTSVVLTATPQDATNVFSGWSGDCSGTSTCVLAMTAPRTVVATFAPVPIAGACGVAGNVAVENAPVAGLCNPGTASAVNLANDTYSWTCAGPNNGSTANCSAPHKINGVCGSANGGTVAGGTSVGAAPSGAAACASGNITGMSTVGTSFNWTCAGVNTGTTSGTCAVEQTPTAGACATLPNAPESWPGTSPAACTAGSVASLAAASNTWTWACNGLAGGGNATGCTAPQQRAGVCGSANGVAVLSTPSSNLCGNGTTASAVSGSGPWSWTCSSINGSTAPAANCSAPTGGGSLTDTGRNTGLWMPSGSNTIFVVDQTGANGAGTTNYVPGCINQTAAPASSSTGCAASSAFFATYASVNRTINLAQGNIISVRVNSKATAPSFKAHQLKSANAGNIGFSVSLWISSVPPGTAGGNYADVPALCKSTSTGVPVVYTATSQCVVTPSTPYYLNIMSNAACSGATCRFQLVEGADFE